MEKFVDFMAGTYGRIIRGVVGLVLLYLAFTVAHDIWVGVLAILGIIFIASGVIGICALNLLIGRRLDYKPPVKS